MNNKNQKRLVLSSWVNILHKQGLISNEKYVLMIKEISKL